MSTQVTGWLTELSLSRWPVDMMLYRRCKQIMECRIARVRIVFHDCVFSSAVFGNFFKDETRLRFQEIREGKPT